jgi:G3E family GTPase
MDVHVGGKKAHERYLMMGQRVELPSRTPRFDDPVDADKQQTEQNNPNNDKNGAQLQDQHHHHHYHHHHHHHHHDEEVRAGMPASKPSCDQDDSNAPAIAIAAGDEESLLLDECQHQNQSRMIDLNSRPKRLLSQASVPDKG